MMDMAHPKGVSTRLLPNYTQPEIERQALGSHGVGGCFLSETAQGSLLYTKELK